MKQWVRLRSWHLQKFVTDMGLIRTYCGRRTAGDVEQVDVRPEGKACESCLRVGR